MKWAFIGSSLNAPQHVAEILPRLRPCRTITTNAAIKLLRPDVYFLSDQVACKRYSHRAAEAKAQGTHCVTVFRHRQALEARNVQWFDEFVHNGVDPPTRERWSAFNQSGPWCMEYACRKGATELHLLGCEGYRDGDSYFDEAYRASEPEPKIKIADSATTVILIKRMTMVLECFPEVPFYVYGSPCYSIPTPNWHEKPAA